MIHHHDYFYFYNHSFMTIHPSIHPSIHNNHHPTEVLASYLCYIIIIHYY